MQRNTSKGAKKQPPTRDGTCKLTLEKGRFVDSHIIPLALTRLSGSGEKFIESGIGHGVKRRANSWYDNALVTRKGEDILAAIDSRAIEQMRKLRLVWSSWGERETLETELSEYVAGKAGWRFVHLDSPADLQLFFLSLLWRAAASSRHEFSEISLEPVILEDLRRRVRDQAAGAFSDYPVQLYQMITKGPLHNRTPLLEFKPSYRFDGSEGPVIQVARLYFDGLIAHIHLPRGTQLPEEYLQTCIGAHEQQVVFAHRFEDSRTAANIREMLSVVSAELQTPPVPVRPLAAAIRNALPWERRSN